MTRKLTVSEANQIAIQEAKDHLLTTVRRAVHNQKIAHHLTDKTGVPFFLSDTWLDNWDAVVEASDYLDDVTSKNAVNPKNLAIFAKF